MCLAGVITRCTLQGIQPVETDMLLTYVLLSAIIISGGIVTCTLRRGDTNFQLSTSKPLLAVYPVKKR
jgi:hypothetical protein